MTNVCMKWRNRFKRKKLVALAEYLEQQTEYHSYKRRIRKSTKDPLWRRNQPYLFTFPYQTNESHATEVSTVGHVISEQHWKSTFDFSEIVNSYGLRRGRVCQIVKLISHFSLKLYMQYWKWFHSMVLGSVGRDYSKTNRVLEFLAKRFGYVASAPLIENYYFMFSFRDNKCILLSLA